MSTPANNPPVPRPSPNLRHCGSCGGAVYKPLPHCKSSGCSWWRCMAQGCERPLNGPNGNSIRRVV